MAKLHKMLEEMETNMNRYDLSDDYLEANGHSTRQIGEFMYGISMVPCDWVYPYLQALATDERLSGIVEAVEENEGESMKEHMNVEDLLKVIHENAVGRSSTFPRGWICVEDFIELLKKMREE